MEKCPGCVDFSTCVKDQRAKELGCKFRLEQNGYLTKKEEAPLRKCSTCKDMTCLKDGIICKAVEKLLPKPRSGGHRNEFPTDNIEGVWLMKKAKECGHRKYPHTYGHDHDWER
jgi:hypothetical protein